MGSVVQRARRIYQEDGMRSFLAAAGRYVQYRVLPTPIAALLSTELGAKHKFNISWRHRLALLRRGFLSRAAALYDFDADSIEDYITDYQRHVKTQTINDNNAKAGDKYRFHEALRDFPDHRPTVFGVVDHGSFYSDRNADSGTPAVETLTEVLDSEHRLVLKPVKSGGGGIGVDVVERSSEGYVVSERPMADDEFESWLTSRESCLVTEFVEQAAYADEMFPRAANTIRIATMVDDEGAFIGGAIHRIGTDDSAPLDNWSAGGLSAPISASGELGQATRYPKGDALTWFSTHPDTGAQIEGRRIPNWEWIRERVLEMAESIPQTPYIGWDILLTEDGFKVIEGNSHFDVDLMQVHQPLLTDDRVRRFYEHHDVVGDSPTVQP